MSVYVCRNAGKESSKERLGGSVLDEIPFLHGCEHDDDEDDSDEEDDFQSMATDCLDGPRNNKKPRVKVGFLEFTGKLQLYDTLTFLFFCCVCFFAPCPDELRTHDHRPGP